MTEPASIRPPEDEPDVWTPGNVTHGPDHTTRNGIERDGADR